jgi:hypothetical protein
MAPLRQTNRARALILGSLGLLAAACSKGGAKSDAGVLAGLGGSNGGGGDTGAGSGGSSTGGGAGAPVSGTGGATPAGAGGATLAGAGGATGGVVGSGGAAGSGGVIGSAGAGGQPAGTCTFSVAHAPSAAIGTVEIVTWTLDVADLMGAQIDFGPAGAPPTMTAPVDLADPNHRTLLLGMKGGKPYAFRIVAHSAATTCISATFSFTTGAVPASAPKIVKTMPGTGAAKGFMITTTGVDNFSHSGGQPDAYIFDTEGDIVWWSSAALYGAPNGISRAHMSWDGKTIWIQTTTSSKIVNISMDGLTTTDYSNVVKGAHHDFAPLPEGGIATLLSASNGGPQSIVHVKVDGTVTPIVADLATIYAPNPTWYPNAIHYYPSDGTFTVSDRQTATSLFVKFKRDGTVVWQLGGSNPLAKSFQLVGISQWNANHGHHLTPDGRFLFFNNISGPPPNGATPRVIELQLDEAAGTATKTWEFMFNETTATALGDAERLPNGNALITNSWVGTMQEVDRSGAIVQTFTNTTFGYVDFRTSLYGQPPR